jgi:hypothetical protein
MNGVTADYMKNSGIVYKLNFGVDIKKIKEIIEGGQLVSGYYQLPSRKEDLNRFILFKLSKKGAATLVYIEGELESDDLITLLFMKKDL